MSSLLLVLLNRWLGQHLFGISLALVINFISSFPLSLKDLKDSCVELYHDLNDKSNTEDDPWGNGGPKRWN